MPDQQQMQMMPDPQQLQMMQQMMMPEQLDPAFQKRVILKVLYTFDKHFQGKDSWSSYVRIRNAFVEHLFNKEGQLKNNYKIRSHHPPRTVKQKSRNLQNAIFERFIHQVEMMQKMTMTNFNDIKANAAVINNNTQRVYVDGGKPQFAYDVGGGTFHLTPERNSHIPLLDSMSNEQLQDGKRRREEDNFICRDPTLFPRLLYPSGMDVRRSVNRERRYYSHPHPPAVRFLYLVLRAVKQWSRGFFGDEYTNHTWDVGYRSKLNKLMENGGIYELHRKVCEVMLYDDWAQAYPKNIQDDRFDKLAMYTRFDTNPDLTPLCQALGYQNIGTEVEKVPWWYEGPATQPTAVSPGRNVTLYFEPGPNFDEYKDDLTYWLMSDGDDV